ncbi:hypothetical protein AB205_0196230, partial [Aquarana catesbeiana]
MSALCLRTSLSICMYILFSYCVCVFTDPATFKFYCCSLMYNICNKSLYIYFHLCCVHWRLC